MTVRFDPHCSFQGMESRHLQSRPDEKWWRKGQSSGICPAVKLHFFRRFPGWTPMKTDISWGLSKIFPLKPPFIECVLAFSMICPCLLGIVHDFPTKTSFIGDIPIETFISCGFSWNFAAINLISEQGSTWRIYGTSVSATSRRRHVRSARPQLHQWGVPPEKSGAEKFRSFSARDHGTRGRFQLDMGSPKSSILIGFSIANYP